MLCPDCGHTSSSVLTTRSKVGRTERRRECDRCGHRFTTFEVYQVLLKSYLRQRPDVAFARVASGVSLRARLWAKKSDAIEIVDKGMSIREAARRTGLNERTIAAALRARQVPSHPIPSDPTPSAGADLAAIWGSVVSAQQIARD